MAGFKVSALCVQDPFEHSHNVTKGIGPGHVGQLLKALERSQLLLTQLLQREHSSQQDILQLFNPPSSAELTSPTGPSGTAAHSVELTSETASHLLLHSQFAELAGRLAELGLNNESVSQRLHHVILHSLTQHLQDEFGVRVQFRQQERSPAISSQPSTVIGQPSAVVSPPNLACVSQPTAGERKRERSMTEEGEEEEMETEGKGGAVSEVKKQKFDSEESAEQLLFRLMEGEALSCQADCVALEQSWIGSRKRRREQMRQGSHSYPAKTTPTTPNSPCLVFTISVGPTTTTTSSSGDIIATIVLQSTDSKFKIPFEMFFSACKRKLFKF